MTTPRAALVARVLDTARDKVVAAHPNGSDLVCGGTVLIALVDAADKWSGNDWSVADELFDAALKSAHKFTANTLTAFRLDGVRQQWQYVNALTGAAYMERRWAVDQLVTAVLS